MEIHKRAARAIEYEADLQRIPYPVIEAVVKAAVEWIANHVPAEFDASEMDAADFDACESCGTLIDPANPAGAVTDCDGVWVCDACRAEEETEPAPGVAPLAPDTAERPSHWCRNSSVYWECGLWQSQDRGCSACEFAGPPYGSAPAREPADGTPPPGGSAP